jgi:uncharacterized protein (TIGR02118 family)
MGCPAGEHAMSITITVLYPNTRGSRFDLDYYLKTHMPLVEKNWRGKGLTAVKLLKAAGTPDPNTPAPYQLIAVLGFESLEAFQRAAKDSAAAIMGDIPNFTDVTPVIQINEDLN